jgi:hypothetical protein
MVRVVRVRRNGVRLHEPPQRGVIEAGLHVVERPLLLMAGEELVGRDGSIHGARGWPPGQDTAQRQISLRRNVTSGGYVKIEEQWPLSSQEAAVRIGVAGVRYLDGARLPQRAQGSVRFDLLDDVPSSLGPEASRPAPARG